MSRRLDKPSGIPKPAKPPLASSSKSASAFLPTASGRLPLSRELANLPPRKRAGSPDIARAKEPRAKLRRSRSFNDLPSIAAVNPLKRTASTLAPIPAKRVAPAVTKAKPPPGTGAVGTKAKPPAAKPAPVKTVTASKAPPVKRIPPYDYKARYNAQLEKYNALKEKFDAQKQQLMEIDNLPEMYEESQAELQKCQQELAATRKHNECLEKESKISSEKIAVLTESLEKAEEQLKNVSAACKTAQESEKKLKAEVEYLKETCEFFTNENDSMRQDLEACRDQLFASVMERKDIHNQMMDLRGNIRVFCRVRPPLASEAERALCGWQYLDEASLEITATDPKNKGTHLEFTFDQVFHPRTSQEDVFGMVSPLIQSALDGYNVCIFAYGQTGSGKTYTMDGSEENQGVIPRTVDLLFNSLKNYRRIGWEYEIRATFLEIYNEVLYDLLDPNATDLEIRMVSPTNKTDVYVSNITEKLVESPEELRYFMDVAKSNRATACTVGNERSSRSHAITRLQLIGVHEGKQEKSVGTINLVDLAGSESPKTSTRMDETKKINRSLSELTNVIMAILNKNDHVPYRNSKLTYLLMPSLGGNSKTLMFINVAPFQECYTESVKSLRFASSVNHVRMSKIRKNRVLNN
ncbi:protein claret segregational [Phlebotomus argentipes]|uniref:protein claret segregational n=1 Tax=Phlebotomus argentipes TaxID=94469 RepID=UPI002892D535|nr:protein claret segregational [Phlebotomus argentipes]